MAIDHPYDALPPGYRLGSYEILRVLGRGGFGLTYQARRAGVAGDMVAIKELFPKNMARRAPNMAIVALEGTDKTQINDSVDMFLREAQLICALDHPNIVHGVDAFHENDTGYLVMRYVTGRNLRDSLRDPTGFRPDSNSLPALLAPMLHALETLHGHELLHCDIKPDNIFLGVGFEPILIDLGSARWHGSVGSMEQSATYSLYFSAIEQVSDHFGSIGPWTDIYQLSAVLYRCITGGKLPDSNDRVGYGGDQYLPLAEIPEVIQAYPRPLLDAVDYGLQIHPQHRPRSVAEWRRSFESLLPRLAPAKQTPAKQSGNRNATPPPPLPLEHWKPDASTGNEPRVPTPGSSSPPDFLMWIGGGLLVLILLIVYNLVVNN